MLIFYHATLLNSCISFSSFCVASFVVVQSLSHVWLFAARHGVLHARFPCPSVSPGICPNSCPLSWWCYPTITSSAAAFSFCLQSFPASGLFQWVKGKQSKVAQSCLTLCNPMDCSLPGSSIHGDFPNESSGVGCHFLLQEIVPTQGLNPGLLHTTTYKTDNW